MFTIMRQCVVAHRNKVPTSKVKVVKIYKSFIDWCLSYLVVRYLWWSSNFGWSNGSLRSRSLVLKLDFHTCLYSLLLLTDVHWNTLTDVQVQGLSITISDISYCCSQLKGQGTTSGALSSYIDISCFEIYLKSNVYLGVKGQMLVSQWCSDGGILFLSKTSSSF